MGLSLYFKCCNTEPNVLFKYEIFKPEYKFLAYYECPNCGKRWFEELKENYSDEEIKELKEQEINGFNEEKPKKFSLIGCIWFVVGMYLIIIILGLIFSGK